MPPPSPEEQHSAHRRAKSFGRAMFLTAIAVAGVVVLAYVAFFVLAAVAMSQYGSNK